MIKELSILKSVTNYQAGLLYMCMLVFITGCNKDLNSTPSILKAYT